MADCYLRKEIGSNVFKKMKDPAQSRYFNIMSNYYDTAWKYGIGQNASKTKTYGKGGAAGSGIHLPEDFQEQNIASMDKIREQMGTSKAMTYISNIANIDKQLKESISSDKAKELKEEKDMNVRALYSLGQTQAGRTEIIGDLTSVFKDREKAVAYYEGIIENYGNSPSTGLPYASPKTENADVYLMLKQWRDTPYLIDNAKDKAIVDSYLNKIEYGHPILEKDFPELQTLITTYNTPEKLAAAKENEYYASKKNDLYDFLKDEKNGLTPSQSNTYWNIYNDIKDGKPLQDWEMNKLSERYPEFRETIDMADQKIEKSLRELMEEVDKGGSGGGRAGQPSEGSKAFTKATVEGLNDDKVLGQGLFASIIALWNKETPAIAPFVGQGIEDANIFTPKSFGPRITNKEGTDDQGLFTYNPITGMAGLSFLPDIPGIVISPITKTVFGYDAVTGHTARPTVGDWVSTILTAAGAAEARGVNVLGTARTTVSDFFSSNLGRFPGGKATTGVADDIIKSGTKAADDLAGVTKDSINKAFINDLNKVQHTYESIGTKNYPSYITESGKKFSSMDDVVSYLTAKRDVAISSLDDMARESTKINNYVSSAKTLTDDVLKEGAKYTDDFWANMEKAMGSGTEKALENYGVAQAGSKGIFGFLPESLQGPAKTVAAIGAGYLGLLGTVGFGGFLVMDDQMQFDEFPITNGLKEGYFASASAAMAADQHKHNTWQFGSALLAELVTLPFAAIDKATGLQTQHNLPVVGQVITAYQAYGQRGERAAYDISQYGLWKGDYKTGRPSTREEIVDWYDLHKNDKTLFPNPPTGDSYNTVKHSYYKAVANNKNYDADVKQISQMEGTPLSQILGNKDWQKADEKTGIKGQGQGTGFGVNQPVSGVLGKSVSDRINTLLGDKTLDSFQIKTLGETFKIPGIDKLNNLLSSDKIQEAKEYLSSKLAEVVPGYKPYEKSAWSTPGSNYKPDRSGICLSACQNACQTAQVYRSNNCGSSQFSAFNVGSGSGGGEAHGGGECREYGCEAVAESRAILCGEGTSCGSKQVVGCAACESAAEALQTLRCGESSTPQPSCGYDLSGVNIAEGTSAGGLPVEKTPEGNVPMEYCAGGSEICSQGESCDSSDISAAQASCHGCETVWQMGCMSKELGMRKKK